MEQYHNGLTSNTITDWIKEDKGLEKIIQEIENKTDSFDEQAELAFHLVSEYFNVPKFLNMEESEDDEISSSVYEQLAILKYLEPNEDLRGLVLTAIYFLQFGYRTSVEFIFEKYPSINKDEITGIGFKGENSKVELVLVKKGESWFDLGCTYFTRTEQVKHIVKNELTDNYKQKNMNELAKIGKRRTILISVSILLVSIHTIYFYHTMRPEIESKKLIQQIIRFLLTIGLLIMVYKGKNWARIVSIILFTLALLGALVGLGTLDVPFINKIPLFVMVFVYSMAIYHFGFAKSFKEFLKFQNSKN